MTSPLPRREGAPPRAPVRRRPLLRRGSGHPQDPSPPRAILETVPDLDFELVYVDNGSHDATLNLLRELQRADARVRVLALSRNFGHETAVTAGLQCAAGDAAVLIDADLQNPPEAIPEIPEHRRRGADGLQGAVSATVASAVQAGAEPMGPWFSLAAGALATALPSAPGHVGTFDWFAAQGLEAYGAPSPRAVAFALTVHAVLWVSSTAAGLFCLLTCGIRPQRVRGASRPFRAAGGLRPRRPSTTRPRHPELPRRQRSGREPRGRPDASDRDTCHGPACRPHRAAPEVSAT